METGGKKGRDGGRNKYRVEKEGRMAVGWNIRREKER